MSESVYPPSTSIAENAHVSSMDAYRALYEESYNDTEGFWGRIAKDTIHWFEPFTKVRKYDFHQAEIAWFLGGKTNIAYNCLDRHLETRGDQTAIIWEGNEPG